MGSRLNCPGLDDRKLREASEADHTIHNASVSTMAGTKNDSRVLESIPSKSIHVQSRI
jgi:hypothetical protein